MTDQSTYLVSNYGGSRGGLAVGGQRHVDVRWSWLILLFGLLLCGRTAAVGDDYLGGTVPEARRQAYAALAAEVDLLERQMSLLKRVVQLSGPAVVHIESSKLANPGGQFTTARSDSRRVEEAGAGVVLEIGGQCYILTNRHVVHPAPLDGIRIELHDRRVIYPRRVWSDRTTDIAVLEVDCTDLISVPLADSDRLEIGDFVLAIGSPFGLSRSVTYGIVSAKGRRNLELGSREIEIQDFIQTDAAINPGNSGGPLMNLRGELVGINTAIASNSGGSEGIGFAIPINLARSVAEQLIARGQVARGYLGVQMDKGFDASAARRLGLSRSEGALIKVVKPNSPAERAGIRVGDVIVSFDQTRVENDDHLLQLVGLTPVGRTVSVELVRDRQLRRINLRLAEFPADL